MSVRFAAALLATLTLLTPAAFGQGPSASEKAMQDRMAFRQLRDALRLTPDQNQKIREIRRKYLGKMTAVRFKFEPELAPLRTAASSQPGSRDIQVKISSILKRVDLVLAPLEKQKHQEELSVYTPEQRKLVTEFEKKLTVSRR